MVEWIDWPQVQAAVEFGPGTGAFTGHILERLRPAARFFAVELNPALVDVFSKAHPSVQVYRDSVANVKSLCAREGIDRVDAIVCGLPWAAFSSGDQAEFLAATQSVLRPGGQFATFAYLQGLLLPAGQRFRKRLRGAFASVERSRTVWRNLPPAFVYRCRR
ncbi:MAG: methyltransferase domain-containing protein [bacterium]|nr:methyltransferase domain-containing protein [bacterium]